MLSSILLLSQLVGFEAKAKDLRFEAKNFKMCPRRHRLPRGLHLCMKYDCQMEAVSSLEPNLKI